LRHRRDVGQFHLDVRRLKEVELRLLPVDPQVKAKARGRGDVGLAEPVIVEPVCVALLDVRLGRVPHEQQLLVAEAEGEVGEERTGKTYHVVRVVHDAARLRLVDQRDPPGADRLLPGVGEIEGMAKLVYRGEEPQPAGKGLRVRLRRRARPR
jgi:hypothetical protein